MEPNYIDNSKFRILLVDDEQDIIDILDYNLRKEGFQLFSAKDGEEAIELAKEISPQIIILDIMMPVMDGVETCKKIKEIKSLQNTLVAFLTARSEEFSEIACLEAGADDFLKKPLKPKLFLSHVKALIRRYNYINGDIKQEDFPLKPIMLNLDTYQVFKHDEEIFLTKKEFDLLHLLMAKKDKILLREEIFRKIWGSEVIVGERTIDVHISKLRNKIGAEHIRTLKKVGYQFID